LKIIIRERTNVRKNHRCEMRGLQAEIECGVTLILYICAIQITYIVNVPHYICRTTAAIEFDDGDAIATQMYVPTTYVVRLVKGLTDYCSLYTLYGMYNIYAYPYTTCRGVVGTREAIRTL